MKLTRNRIYSIVAIVTPLIAFTILSGSSEPPHQTEQSEIALVTEIIQKNNIDTFCKQLCPLSKEQRIIILMCDHGRIIVPDNGLFANAMPGDMVNLTIKPHNGIMIIAKADVINGDVPSDRIVYHATNKTVPSDAVSGD